MRPSLSRAGWLNLGLAGVLAAVVAGTWTAIGAAAPEATATTRTATVTQGSLTATVSGSGNLASSRTASLSFGASGNVTDLDVEVGDEVKKGEVLATIDTEAAERNLSAAEAQLDAAQASYSDTVSGGSSSSSSNSGAGSALGVQAAQAGVTAAKQKLKNDTRTQNALVAEAEEKSVESAVLAARATRDDVLAKDQQAILTAQQQLAQAKSSSSQGSSSTSSAAQIASANVDVENAEASVQEAEDALDATKIKAPFSGTVLTVAGEVGDSVSAGSSSSDASSSGGSATGTTGAGGATADTGSSSSSSSGFITMATTTKLEVTADIAEADIGDVEVGQAATVTLLASNETAEGTVTLVSPEGSTSNNVVQYPVTVALDAAPDAARIGSTASISITTGEASDALLLQTSAITTNGSRNTVQVVRNGVTETVSVETGLVGASQTEIVSGLSAGDVVQIPESDSTTGGGFPGLGGGGLGGGGLGRP